MSHVDEGRLHAYLDALERDPTGALEWRDLERHVDGCATCRGRLEEARALRDRASAILRASGPRDAAPPAFEEIIARKRALATRRTVFRLNRLTAVGWAATIIMAVGVGWIARGLEFTGPEAALSPAAETRGPAEAAALEAPPDVEFELAEAPRSAEPASEPGAALPAPATPAVEGGPPAAALDAVVDPVAEREQPLAPPPAPSPAAGAGELRKITAGVRGAEPAAARDSAARAPADDRLRQRRMEVAPHAVAAEAAARDVEAERALVARAAEETARSWPREQEPAFWITWRETTLEDAAAHLGVVPLTHPDLVPLTVEAATIGDVPVIRITLLGAPNEFVEVTQWRREDGTPPLTPSEINAITGSTNLFRRADITRVYVAEAHREGRQLHGVGMVWDRLQALLEELR